MRSVSGREMVKVVGRRGSIMSFFANTRAKVVMSYLFSPGSSMEAAIVVIKVVVMYVK